MISLTELKAAIDALTPAEQQDLLCHLAAKVETIGPSESEKAPVCQDRWLTEEESDLQYLIPEAHHRAAKSTEGEID